MGCRKLGLNYTESFRVDIFGKCVYTLCSKLVLQNRLNKLFSSGFYYNFRTALIFYELFLGFKIIAKNQNVFFENKVFQTHLLQLNYITDKMNVKRLT